MVWNEIHVEVSIAVNHWTNEDGQGRGMLDQPGHPVLQDRRQPVHRSVRSCQTLFSPDHSDPQKCITLLQSESLVGFVTQ